MKLRGAIFCLGCALLAAAGLAQNSPQSSAQDTLPSAPSAVKQERSKPKPPPPAPAAAPAASPASEAAATDPPQTTSDPQTGNKATAKAPQAGPAQDAKADTAAKASDASSSDDSATTITKTVNEVNVVFTVTDKHGRYVRNLSKGDFAVLDDSKPAEQIRSFHNETDLPLQVGLLVDASNSVRDRFKFEQESAIEFLNQTVRPKYDKAFIVGFDVTPEVTQDFTDNTEALSRGVRALRPGGGTAMYDALYFAARDKLLKEQQNGPVRRAIILLSDGDDNMSHVTREEAIDMAQRAEVIVYTISTNVTGSRRAGDKVLERIADATGGRSFFPFQITDVANAFVEIQDELRSQYALSYKPADLRTDGRYHTIEILAQNHKGLRVRSRRGYYAPTAQ
ncbi:MAG TPA: VWA domain-containing protein [Terriglobales bacterium]|jgi:VWFA-related protein|nr:VWA domain-containing protein [Terriglobales bacterium]